MSPNRSSDASDTPPATENRRGGRNDRRLLILGPIDTPHTEHLAIAARERGFYVCVAGWLWGTSPHTTYAEHGIEVSIREWPTARWVRGLMERVQPDVVHANWFPSAFLYLLYGASPMVAMAWGSDVYRASWLTRAKNRAVARLAGVVMADSADLLAQLRLLGADPDRSVLFNWGIDLRTFSPPSRSRAAVREELGLPEGRIILSPRAFRDVYNPHTIVEAFDVLADRRDDVHLVIKHLHADEPDLGSARHRDRIHAVGHVPYERMADYYGAADVCVSIPSSDSSPRTVWEAMGCGVPCVLSDLPWVHELIGDEREALIVPIDAASVAGAIARLLDDDDLAGGMADRARTLVEIHRDRELELDHLVELYDRVATERTGTSRRMRALQSAATKTAVALAVTRRRLRPRDGVSDASPS